MPENQMTDWFSFLTRPVHVGWYEVKTTSWPFPHRMEWSGSKWITAEEITEWRGFTSEQPPIVLEETRWKIEPTWKKSTKERSHFHKDGKTIIVETGWRWSCFYLTTETSEAPDIEAGVDLYDCGYEVEMDYCDDGCWEDYEYFNMSAEEIAEVETFMEENSFLDLEELGWVGGDTEMIIDCDLSIEKVES
jgi:hypothetical protein